MVGNDACLGKFTNIENQTKVKNCGAISPKEVSLELLRETGMKRKLGAETTFMTGGDGPREAVRGVQYRKHQHIVQPYSTDLEDFLKKSRKYAGKPSLGKIVTTAASPEINC